MATNTTCIDNRLLIVSALLSDLLCDALKSFPLRHILFDATFYVFAKEDKNRNDLKQPI